MNVYPADVVDVDTDAAKLRSMSLYLQTRFFPPLPAEYAPIALAAVRLAADNLDGDDETQIIIAADVDPKPREATAWSNGQALASPAHIVEILRLWHAVEDLRDEADGTWTTQVLNQIDPLVLQAAEGLCDGPGSHIAAEYLRGVVELALSVSPNVDGKIDHDEAKVALTAHLYAFEA